MPPEITSVRCYGVDGTLHGRVPPEKRWRFIRRAGPPECTVISLKVHPFADGNGRTSRLFKMNLELLKAGVPAAVVPVGSAASRILRSARGGPRPRKHRTVSGLGRGPRETEFEPYWHALGRDRASETYRICVA